jgi:hypothetical protein
MLLARLYEAEGQLAKAREELAQVVALEERVPEYLARFVSVLIRTEEFDAAASYLNRWQALEPDTARVQLLRDALKKARAAAK